MRRIIIIIILQKDSDIYETNGEPESIQSQWLA